LLDPGGGCRAVFAWSPVQRNKQARYRVRWWVDGGKEPAWTDERITPLRAGAVGALVAGYVKLMVSDGGERPVVETVLACESGYVGKDPQASLKLARFSGGIVAPLEEALGRTSSWILPDVWRATTIGVRRGTPRAACKRASLRLVPARVKGLRRALDHLGELDHVTDAAGVASCARVAT